LFKDVGLFAGGFAVRGAVDADHAMAGQLQWFQKMQHLRFMFRYGFAEAGRCNPRLICAHCEETRK